MECSALIREIPPYSVAFPGSIPLISSIIQGEIMADTEKITELLRPYEGKLRNSDFSSLMWQIRYGLILKADSDEEAENAYYRAADIDCEEIGNSLNPLHLLYMQDEAYRLSTPETRAHIRALTEKTAAETEIPEDRLSKEYMKLAENGNMSVCEVVTHDYLRVFPKVSVPWYIAAVMLGAVFVTLVTVFFSDWFVGLNVFAPALAISKTVIDHVLMRNVEKPLTPSYNAEEAENYKTVCALSVLADSPESITEGINRLEQARLRNKGRNLVFCLLCDLPPAKTREADSDNHILDSIPDSDFIILVRHRDYSSTQGMYQGKERKRGAIDDLVRYINGENISFRHVSGEITLLRDAPFICTLDYDTIPFMDSINELVAAAIHPVNKDFGIFAPRITTTLDSSSRTGLSRLWSGNGGCCGASAYDNADTELYSSCFGEGIFTGKGLIRTDDYYEKVCGAFPDEKILSHDILEGGLLTVLYCGETEFADSFPPTTKGYFRRNHRWMRGDFQNWRFLLDKRFSTLTKFKLSENIRRALAPFYALSALFLSAVCGYTFPAAVTVLSLVLPYLMGLVPVALKGIGFSNTREFYSPFLSQSRTLVSQLFGEIIFLARNTYESVDAFLRTLYRVITGKRLLQWTTASAFDKVSAVGYGGFIIPEIISLALFSVSVYYNNVFTAIIALFMVCAPVAAVCLDRVIPSDTLKIKQSDRLDLIEEAEKYWAFFTDYVTEKENFLPPDNVQYTPVYRVARRTSPTNIGMYLLSCVCAAELRITDNETTETCISRTVSTIEKMEKYRGNLYNWYSTEDLSVLGSFVSSVDSGNFLCCMVAVKEWVRKKRNNTELVCRMEKIIKDADLKIFYNKPRNLFSTGIDAKTGKLTANCYDMLMSEARMFSYFAIATGQAPKKHWQSLSRTMSQSGKYAGPVAWTGTMFEFFMPELLLESRRGSLGFEALRYAVHCQKERGRKKGLPFGVSESAYYSFDRNLNYLYKAHGVQALALCGGMNREYVISPYSTFLALSHSFNACMTNFARLCQPEFVHGKYGCFEAIDLTPHRTGAGEGVVKSHMAHHIGMSMGGITNALSQGILKKLFLSDEAMAGATELLEEKIMTGERIIDIKKLRDRSQPAEQTEESTAFSILRPEISIAANHKLAVFTTDTGLYYGRYMGRSTMVKSPDFLRRPDGMFFAVTDGEKEIPFFLTRYDRGGSLERSVVSGENHVEYYVNSPSLKNGMKLSLFGENAAEIREFAIENISGAEKNVSLTAFLRPCLMDDNAYASHPAFGDMFLKTEYENNENVVLAHRKNRDSDEEIWLCVGFKEAAEFNYSFSREDVMSYDEPLSFTKKAGNGTDNPGSVPSPCIFIDLPVKIGNGHKFTTEMFICYGQSRDEVLGICHDIRSGKEEKPPVSPLPKTTLQGQLARKILVPLIYRNITCEEILNPETSLTRESLLRFGLTPHLPLFIYDYDGDNMNLEGTVLAMNGLADCGINAELAVLCSDEARQRYISGLVSENSINASVIIKSSLSHDEKGILYKSAVFVFGKSEIKKAPQKLMDIVPCEADRTGGREGFGENCFITDKKGHPWCNVIASRNFGCIVSHNSLGFTYAINSRENKLTPWYNDTMHDNDGEMLLVKGMGKYYDIIKGARTVFAPNKADYYGKVRDVHYHTAVRVYQKGMGKEITVSVTNTGRSEKKISLSYYIEPVLGTDRAANNYGAGLKLSEDENAVYLKGRNNGFEGEIALYCDRETQRTTNREWFMAGITDSGVMPCMNGCAALTAKIKVKPDDTVKVKFILAFAKKNSRKQLEAFKNVSTEWEKEFSPVLNSNNPVLNKLYDTWLPWQTLGCRMWARSGFYQNGGAFGFRDQLQDSMAAVYFSPKEAKRQILNCCASQFTEGDVLHWWHRTGAGRRGVRTICSDDLLWLPYVTAHYIKESGDKDILRLNVRYVEGEPLRGACEKYMEVKISDASENVYMHCKKALEKGFKKGDKGLIQIAGGDWNDGYNRVGSGGRGESVWLAMFYVLTVKEFAPVAREMHEEEYALELEKRAAELTAAITESAYENGYFLRAFYDDGTKMGSADSDCCKIDLLTQAFSVLADIPDEEKRKSALDNAYRQLVDEENGIIKLFTPAFSTDSEKDPGYVKSYPEGVRENGGQYTHGAVWLALAFLRNGDRKTAKKLAEILSPANRPAIYRNEPYYMSADIYTNPQAYGRGGWSLYTGSAAWYYMLLRELYGEE